MADPDIFAPVGDLDIDETRRAVKAEPSTRGNARRRIEVLYQWAWYLQRQGVDVGGLIPIRTSGALAGGEPLRLEDGDVNKLGSDLKLGKVDEGYALLERLQRGLNDSPPQGISRPDAEPAEPADGEEFVCFQANWRHDGHTDNVGPTRGTLAWKRPLGYAWYSRPVVEDGAVYVTSPGTMQVAYKLDAVTGDVVWRAKRTVKDREFGNGSAIYWMPVTTSSPHVTKDAVLLREMGSRGNRGAATDIVVVDKQTGEHRDFLRATHVDYRTGYPAFAGDDDTVLYLSASHDIEHAQPLTGVFDEIVSKDIRTGERRWSMFVGDTACEPVIDGGQVFLGTQDGHLLCLLNNSVPEMWAGNTHPADRLVWRVRCGGAVNTRPTVTAEVVIVGDNSGVVRCIDRASGKARWTFETPAHKRAWMFFSPALIHDGRVYVGDANGEVHILDLENGRRLATVDSPDWVRGRAVVVGDTLVFACLDGEAHGVSLADHKVKWTTKLSDFPVFADLASDGTRAFVSTSDLNVHAVNAATGDKAWTHSLIPKNDHGHHTDRICGGSYYQSTPIIAEGKVFLGGPDRMVHAYDFESGKELWRYEASAAISSPPVYHDGKVFFGQQGGNRDFYAVDAATGDPAWVAQIGWVWSGAAVAQGRVCAPSVNGHLYGLDEQTGEVVWDYRTSRAAHPLPPTDGTHVYFGSWDGYYYKIAAVDGALAWKYYTGLVPDSGSPLVTDTSLQFTMGPRMYDVDRETGELIKHRKLPVDCCNATPAIKDGVAYVSTQTAPGYVPLGSHMIRFEVETGRVLWDVVGGGLTAAIDAKNHAYFGCTSDPFFYCVDKDTGETLWRYKMGDITDEGCTGVAGGRAFVSCADGYLYAFD